MTSLMAEETTPSFLSKKGKKGQVLPISMMKDKTNQYDSQQNEKEAWQPIDVLNSKRLYNDLLKPESNDKENIQIQLPEWNSDCGSSPPPNPLTVTKINQKNQLQSVHDLKVTHAYEQSSEEWLDLNGLESKNLNIDQLFQDGKQIGLPIEHSEPQTERYKFEMSTLMEFEFKINRLKVLLKQRIEWLLSDSKQIFGLIKGRNPCVLVDASDENFEDEDLPILQAHLKDLMKDQLLKKAKLSLASFGTDVNFLWTSPRIVNNFTGKECYTWISSLRNSGRCNLLQALRAVLKQKDIDSIVLIQRNRPDQNQSLIVDYAFEAALGRNITFHVVSYKSPVLSTEIFVEELASRTGGRYHCFRLNDDPEDVKSTDMKLLTDELAKCEETAEQLEDLKDGNEVKNKVIAAIRQPSEEIIQADYHRKQEERLKKLDEEYQSLTIEPSSSVIERTSKEWLKAYSLKTKGLTLYQVMAPNAYSYVTGYVSTINKRVESKTHHKSMVQMEWHDGSTKNVHIDPVLMFNYQHHLRSSLEIYEKRLNWLNFESRKWFGILAHKRIVIIVDMCSATQFTLGDLQLSLKVLLQQQLSNKILFNMVCCGETMEHFKPTMVEASRENITECWRWFNQQCCGGVRTFLPALRYVLENEEEKKQNIEIDGIYLISTGMPNEPEELICSYVSEATLGSELSLNCIYFQPASQGPYTLESYLNNAEDVARYMRDLAHLNRGRFHWINSQEIEESDDVSLVREEIDKATNYLNKSQLLIDRMQFKKEEKVRAEQSLKLLPAPPPSVNTSTKALVPRTTALTEARMNIRPKSSRIAQVTKKPKRRIVSAKLDRSSTGAWKPSSAHPTIPAVPDPVPGRPVKKTSVVDDERPTRKIFYTEIGNDVGCIIGDNKLASPSKKRFSTLDINIPDVEANISSKNWLYKYSLSRLKLDLHELVRGTECCHTPKNVTSIKKSVQARYCDIFPTVEIKDKMYHLQLPISELENYEKSVEKALRCYTKRLMWLLQGSRNIFGSIIEKNVVIVIDTSGSMIKYISKLKEQLDCLIYDQLEKGGCRFNFIQYSSDVRLWQGELMDSSKENCQHASNWLQEIKCYGETCTLAALQAAFDNHDNLEGIYLLTDGKPNSSTTMVLREAANMNMNRNIKIHTISFNCNDITANTFLQMLASQSKGRFHKFQSEVDDAENLKNLLLSADSSSQDVLKNTAIFESDDVNLIVKEINRARQYLLQSKHYRSLLRKPPK